MKAAGCARHLMAAGKIDLWLWLMFRRESDSIEFAALT